MEVEDEAIRSLRLYSAWQESCSLYPCLRLHNHVNHDAFLGGREFYNRKKLNPDIFGAKEFEFSALGETDSVKPTNLHIESHSSEGRGN